MKKQLLLFCVCFPIWIYAQKMSTHIDYPIANIPENLLNNAHTVVRHAAHHITLENEAKINVRRKGIITILNNKSRHKNLQVYYNDFRKIKSIQAAIYDANGKRIKVAKKKDILDYSLVDEGTIANDDRLKEIKLLHYQYPYTLVYEYEVEITGSYFMPDWHPVLGYKTAVEFAACTVSALNNQTALFKENQPEYFNQEKTKITKESKYWELGNFEAVVYEPLSPPSNRIFPSVQLASENLSLHKQVSKVDSWEAFARFYYQLNKDHNDISEDLKSEIQSLTKDAKSNREKINLLYQFLQENTRYISIQLGVGGLKTFKGSFVEKNKYGDCKALTYFMKSMLEEIDIVAYPVLIDAGRNPREIDSDFATHLFNHVILYVPEDNIWLECTSSSDYTGLVTDFIAGRKALLVKENGGGLIDLPAYEKSQISVENSIHLTENSSANFSAHISLKGLAHEDFRGWNQFLSPDKQIKEFEKYIQSPIEANSLTFDLTSAKTASEVKINASYTAKGFVSKSNKRIFVPVKSEIDFYNNSFPVLENRKQNVIFNNEKEYYEMTTLNIPKGFVVESLPKERNISSDFGTFSLTFVSVDHTIQIVKKGEFVKGAFTADQYQKLLEFYDSINATNNLKIVLTQQK